MAINLPVIVEIDGYENHKSCSPSDATERIEESSVASAITNPDKIGDSFGRRKLVQKAIGDKTLEVVYRGR